MTTGPSTTFMPSYNINQTSLWASDLNLTQLPGWLAGETPYTTDGRSFMNETMYYAPSEQNISTDVQLPMAGCHEGNPMQETFSSPSSIHSDLSTGAPVNQPLYYVATGETSISKTSPWYSILTFKLQQRDCSTSNLTSHEQYFSTNQNHRPHPFRTRNHISNTTSLPAGKQWLRGTFASPNSDTRSNMPVSSPVTSSDRK